MRTYKIHFGGNDSVEIFISGAYVYYRNVDNFVGCTNNSLIYTHAFNAVIRIDRNTFLDNSAHDFRIHDFHPAQNMDGLPRLPLVNNIVIPNIDNTRRVEFSIVAPVKL